MTYFTIPKTRFHLIEKLKKGKNSVFIKKTNIIVKRNTYVDSFREQMQHFEHWNMISRIYFPYEFINEVFNVFVNDTPLYESFFSIRYALHIELIKFLRVSTLTDTTNAIKILTFSQNDHYNLKNMHYVQNRNIDNVFINIDYTTNINTILSENLSSIDYISVGTHSSSENEIKYGKIAYTCVLYTLCLQKHNGNFILKLFNVDSTLSIGIIALLSSLYKEVFIVKPDMSYEHSSELFVVCKHFVPESSNSFYKTLIEVIHNMHDKDIDDSYEIFDTNIINLVLQNKINEVAVFFYQRQLDFTHTIINTSVSQSIINGSVIKGIHGNKTKIHAIIKSNVEKCVRWICQNNYSSKNYKQSEISALIDIIAISVISY
jgi:23S rRNA U2552 (ribose-2'-O)-methylase RlmE/FtsJ